MELNIRDRNIVALDVEKFDEAERLVKMLIEYVSTFKIGLFLSSGVWHKKIADMIYNLGGSIFCDFKYREIPQNVGKAVREIVGLTGVKMFTVYADGGSEMMREAKKHKGEALALAVTVPTWLSPREARLIYGVPLDEKDGPAQPELSDEDWVIEKVKQLAYNASWIGLDGVICSPQEIPALNSERSIRPLVRRNAIATGVRPPWAPHDDQKRVMTPYDAIRSGVERFVIGRPVTRRLYEPRGEVENPVIAIQLIQEDIQRGLCDRKSIF